MLDCHKELPITGPVVDKGIFGQVKDDNHKVPEAVWLAIKRCLDIMIRCAIKSFVEGVWWAFEGISLKPNQSAIHIN